MSAGGQGVLLKANRAYLRKRGIRAVTPSAVPGQGETRPSDAMIFAAVLSLVLRSFL